MASTRRQFLRQGLCAGATLGLAPALARADALSAAGCAPGKCDCSKPSGCGQPAWLDATTAAYARSPRQAALDWFRDARFGLFLHYGVYSLLGRGAPVQFDDRIHVADYARLADRFTARKFDADFITDLACAAGMKYINLTTRHHDSFCLFDSAYTDFKSTHTPAKRDLVAELAGQCARKKLAFFLYYSHGRDWRHPDAPNNDRYGSRARPEYAEREPAYHTGAAHDLQRYVGFMYDQITELLTHYGPIAGIWLDGIGTPLTRRETVPEWHLPELYRHIWSLQPQTLVSYKQGLIGIEDFLAPERNWQRKAGDTSVVELCDTLQPRHWGYHAADDGKHYGPDQVMAMLTYAAAVPANLLLNTGPRAEGDIDPQDVLTLREVGHRLGA